MDQVNPKCQGSGELPSAERGAPVAFSLLLQAAPPSDGGFAAASAGGGHVPEFAVPPEVELPHGHSVADWPQLVLIPGLPRGNVSRPPTTCLIIIA
jgi:hypothetical protein